VRSSDIRIREAKPKDFVRVAQMHYPAWRQSWKGIVATHVLDMIGTPQNWVDMHYPTTLKRGGWSMWMAESRGQLLGMMLLGPDLSNPNHIQIDALYVADQNQRSGVGGLLQRAVGVEIEQSREIGSHGHPLMKPVFLTALRTSDIVIGVLNASGAGLTDLPA